MADPVGQGTDTAVISDAFLAARELIRSAEEDAARIRADVDRYVRQREQEAELIVAKARRLLTMAEARATAIDASDAPGAVIPVTEGPAAPPVAERSQPAGIDGILAAAIAKAFDQSFPE